MSALRPVTPTTILSHRLAELTRTLDAAAESGAIDSAVAHEARSISALASGLDDYVTQQTSPELAMLAELSRRSAEHRWSDAVVPGGVALEPEMLSGHVEGQFLRFLTSFGAARNVLDIGLFTGYSALAMAEAGGDVGRVVSCEIDPDAAALARMSLDASGLGDRVDIRLGPALETLRSLDEGCRTAMRAPFDLVFVDADKAGYIGYVDYLLSSELLAEGALIVVDNTLMQGLPWTDPDGGGNGGAIAEFNAWLQSDSRCEQVVIPLRDGVTLIRRLPCQATS